MRQLSVRKEGMCYDPTEQGNRAQDKGFCPRNVLPRRGWVLSDKNMHDRLIREIANGAGTAVVFVNFTPSPEAKYPSPDRRAYAATKYIAENGKSLNLDSSRLVVAGDSVGGNMATAVALLAKERGGLKIGFQLLFYPVTDANFDTPSYQQFATGHFLTRGAMKWFWDNYLPDVKSTEAADGFASPCFCRPAQKAATDTRYQRRIRRSPR